MNIVKAAAEGLKSMREPRARLLRAAACPSAEIFGLEGEANHG